MQITTKKGTKKVKLSQGEKTALETVIELCDDLSRMFDDAEATTALDCLNELAARYADAPAKDKEEETNEA